VMLKSADTLGSRVMVKAVSWHPRLECLKIYFITNLRSSAVIFVRTVSCYPHVLASYFIVVVVLLLKFHLVQICTNVDVGLYLVTSARTRSACTLTLTR